jgi:hypothetical protein
VPSKRGDGIEAVIQLHRLREVLALVGLAQSGGKVPFGTGLFEGLQPMECAVRAKPEKDAARDLVICRVHRQMLGDRVHVPKAAF